MTVDCFLKIFKAENAKTSSKNIELKSGKKIPLYAIEEISDTPGNKEYTYYSYNAKNESYSIRKLYWDEGLLTHYLYHNEPEQFQKLLDSGTLYKEIIKKMMLANKAIDANVAEWEKNDTECQLAKMNGETELYKRLLNNLRLQARTEVYKNILWT